MRTKNVRFKCRTRPQVILGALIAQTIGVAGPQPVCTVIIFFPLPFFNRCVSRSLFNCRHRCYHLKLKPKHTHTHTLLSTLASNILATLPLPCRSYVPICHCYIPNRCLANYLTLICLYSYSIFFVCVLCLIYVCVCVCVCICVDICPRSSILFLYDLYPHFIPFFLPPSPILFSVFHSNNWLLSKSTNLSYLSLSFLFLFYRLISHRLVRDFVGTEQIRTISVHWTRPTTSIWLQSNFW